MYKFQGENKMTKIAIKELLELDYIIVCDTNVLLNVYRYSPEFTDFALKCLSEVKDKIVMPYTVTLEYKRHNKKEYHAMKKRVQKASSDIKSQMNSTKNKITNSCDVLMKLQYPDIELLKESLLEKLTAVEAELEAFFDDRSVLGQIADIWGKRDLVYELFEEIEKKQEVKACSQEELYSICEEGEKRYKDNIPPGYKDAKNKDGLRKYSDLIIWKEIINYSKDTAQNIIFVTDDKKEDWWESDNIFHKKLVEEFENETSMKIVPFTSIGFYAEISKDYGIKQTDAIGLALKATDQEYFERVEEKDFEKLSDDIAWSGDSLVDTNGAHIGGEGIDELEIINHEFVSAFQLDRSGNETTYFFTYLVEAEGTSFEYWGRDDDTKEIILSPGSYHRFEGEVCALVVRETETFIDYTEDVDFKYAALLSGDMKEVEYVDSFERDSCHDGYTHCPDCGAAINFENDGLSGFCIDCTDKH